VRRDNQDVIFANTFRVVVIVHNTQQPLDAFGVLQDGVIYFQSLKVEIFQPFSAFGRFVGLPPQNATPALQLLRFDLTRHPFPQAGTVPIG